MTQEKQAMATRIKEMKEALYTQSICDGDFDRLPNWTASDEADCVNRIGCGEARWITDDGKLQIHVSLDLQGDTPFLCYIEEISAVE